MQRNYLYDNTTFLVIFLVVFGHLLEPLAGQGGVVRALSLSIYSFLYAGLRSAVRSVDQARLAGGSVGENHPVAARPFSRFCPL